MRRFNEGKSPITVSVAVKCGDQWAYFESRSQQIQSDTWQVVAFDLQDKSFKSEASNWQHSVAVGDLGQVRELQLQVHNGKNNSAMLFNQLGFQPTAKIEE